jgi:hypothetical protein
VRRGEVARVEFRLTNAGARAASVRARPVVTPEAQQRALLEIGAPGEAGWRLEPGASRTVALPFVIDPRLPVGVDRLAVDYRFEGSSPAAGQGR